MVKLHWLRATCLHRSQPLDMLVQRSNIRGAPRLLGDRDHCARRLTARSLSLLASAHPGRGDDHGSRPDAATGAGRDLIMCWQAFPATRSLSRITFGPRVVSWEPNATDSLMHEGDGRDRSRSRREPRAHRRGEQGTACMLIVRTAASFADVPN